jgi:L-ascorbate metabolism protein UlaG (beta-lactamase superfamily)
VPVYQNAASTDAIRGAAFVFDLGTLCIVHLGDLAHTLAPEQIKQIGKVDVALTPIDGSRTMPPDIAREVLAQLKPKIAIPMHYRDNMYLIREFTKGIKAQIMKTDTLVVSKAALPGALEIKVLQPRVARSYE